MSATIHNCVTKYQGSVFKLVTENITLENGVTTDIDIIRHPGASAIVPITDHNTIILLRQYRHAAGGTIWEIPAGTFNRGEDPISCARRELVEETGFSGSTFHKLGEITPVPGYSDERIHLFIATDLEPARQNLDKDELLETAEIQFADAVEMVYKNTIQDAKTICGILLASRFLNKD